MRHLLFCSVLVLSMACPVGSRPPAVDPNSFHTSANFSVDGNAMSLSTAVAAIEPRRAGLFLAAHQLLFLSRRR
jgi:hypothetical protein